ncbi:MAG: N-acetylmuramoyl-L-alanine amidase [Porphyromonas sp.]|nr:N-acetylmuramoyl-L-alanine amidase [Porphyromonas sp.]
MTASEVKYIVIHCSATRSNMSYSAWQLDRDHRSRGFREAGYHFYIARSGDISPMRSIHQVGAHVAGYNHCSIGVCYEGGLSPAGVPQDTRTAEQKRTLRQLLGTLVELFPKAEIVGHRDLSPDRNGDGKITTDEYLKACPCFDARKEYALL